MNFLISVVFREIWKTLSNVLRRIVDRFDKTGDVSKGKSSGRPQVSEDIVEDLRERMENMSENCEQKIKFAPPLSVIGSRTETSRLFTSCCILQLVFKQHE
jgi:hypothetical protein